MTIYNNVSQTQMSIARHYGGMKINGVSFIYDYANDSLVAIKDKEEYVNAIGNIDGAKKPRWTP